MRTVAELFDPRSNSIGFIRWLLAFMVIFSHAGPLGNFYGGRDLGTQWSEEQSFGGVAVAGFFFFSGFLITKSRSGRSTTARYFWRRVLRIMPAFWTTFLFTAFVLGPIAFMREEGTLSGYFTAQEDSPFTYISNNLFLILNQPNIAGLGDSIPYGATWNGSAWTLAYEFGAYIAVGVLGAIGALRHRILGAIFAFAMIGLATLQWLRVGDVSMAGDLFSDFRVLLLMAPFAFGMLFALYGEKIPVDGRVAAVAIVIAALTYGMGGWLAVGQYFFFYFLMWFAIRVHWLRNWERPGDFSYGVYIFAWPIQQMAAYFGLHEMGWLIYHASVVVVIHILAFASWHLIEKPAMSLKDWTPKVIARALEKSRPTRDRWRSRTGELLWADRPEAEAAR